MRKIIFLFILICLIGLLPAGILAQEQEIQAGLLPDSPFYFLERISEGIRTFFTFGDLKKAERHAALAAERLAEARAVVEKGKPKFAEKTLERYEMQLENSIARTEKAIAKGENTGKVMEVIARVGTATSKHLEVLAEVYEKVPEQAKPAIENAMKVSVKGHERAVEALKAKNALGGVPEEVPLPERVPQEVRERVQTRVQQELELEKTLEGVDMSKSLKDICAEQGGTPEMCEQFPAEKFKSFKEIEDYCLGLGGQADVCSTLEQKCREFGITDANECFILLSVSSIKAYQSAELKAVPARSLSEEEMEARRIQGESGGEPTEAEKSLKQRYTPNVSRVIIYSTPTSPHCVKARDWFSKNNIAYEEIDISQDEIKQKELIEKVGQLAVPIIEVEGDIIVGFNEENLSELFGIE